MKAILLVFVFYAAESTHSQWVEMPTMAGCEIAAQKINTTPVSAGGMTGKYLFALCVERR